MALFAKICQSNVLHIKKHKFPSFTYLKYWFYVHVHSQVNNHDEEPCFVLVQNQVNNRDEEPWFVHVQNQVMVALIGQAVFDGSFFSSAHSVQFRLEYLVSGFDVTQVGYAFLNFRVKSTF